MLMVQKDGKSFVSAEIPGMEYYLRPCFYAPRGRLKGSFIRSGDQDLPMTEYEVYSYEQFQQNVHDKQELLSEPSLEFLNDPSQSVFLGNYKRNRPHLALRPDEDILSSLGYIKNNQVSLAGQLLFGQDPQGSHSDQKMTII